MKKRFSLVFLILLCCVFIFSCRPGKDNTNIENKTRTYPCPQGLKTDVAWIVLEWNGKPRYGGYGSGFLNDKEKGIFFTNKHVSDMFNVLGKGRHKIFFNCEVYNAKIVRIDPLADAASIQITDPFNSSNFPDSAPIAKEKIKVGDKVLIEGFHPHPYAIRESNRVESGYNELLVPIYKEYYRMKVYYGGRRISDLDNEMEVVFEKIEGRVIALNLTWEDIMKKKGKDAAADGFIESLGNKINLFHEIRIFKDHKFPFGGLSGGPVRNSMGEIVGITTRQDVDRYEYDEEEFKSKGFAEAKNLWDTVYITPIESVADLRQYLDKK